MNVLETFSLSKRFGRIHAVDRLDLAIPAGSVFGILGPNGSGKTTTLAMALGSVRPDRGGVSWFEGVPLHLARRRIGALVDGPAFYPFLSAEQNLAIVARLKGRGLDRVDAALEQAGLLERRGSPVHTFSLGLRQRLGLAAALLTAPDVLVLDEPTNGLDPHGIADVRRIVRTMASRGTTIVMASHILDEAEKVCTDVAILKDGRLLTSGRLHALLRDGGHAHLEDLYLRLVARESRTA
jgi:ABC-2 type transport system ATP-binding protein